MERRVQKEGGVQGEMTDEHETNYDDSFIPTETDLGTINQLLEFIGVSP